jgi:hemerythrin
MTIVWREQLSVGLDQIDEDHKQLINLINGFEWATSGQIHLDILSRILDELEEYAHGHFEREEKVQASIQFPYRDAHKQAHQVLLSDLKKLREEFAGLDDSSNTEIRQITGRMAVFLRNWLLDHILEEDLRMKPFLAAVER